MLQITKKLSLLWKTLFSQKRIHTDLVNYAQPRFSSLGQFTGKSLKKNNLIFCITSLYSTTYNLTNYPLCTSTNASHKTSNHMNSNTKQTELYLYTTTEENHNSYKACHQDITCYNKYRNLLMSSLIPSKFTLSYI